MEIMPIFVLEFSRLDGILMGSVLEADHSRTRELLLLVSPAAYLRSVVPSLVKAPTFPASAGAARRTLVAPYLVADGLARGNNNPARTSWRAADGR